MTGTTSPEVRRRRDLSSGPLARYTRMLELRHVEDRVKQLFADGSVPGTTHTAQGQEAVAVSLAAATTPDDAVTCTYRGHGIALALGMEPAAVIGEIMGRSRGAIGGVGGSMHLSDPSIGLLPTFAIVGAGLPVAVGAAIAARHRGTAGIGVAVCGDGATNIGAFHEALNLAAVWDVPVLFVVENNLYGEYSPLRSTTPLDDLYLRGASYAMASSATDGQDVETLLPVMQEEVRLVRETSRPRLLEVKTYRFVGHSRSDPAAYRPDGELERWLERDPLRLSRDRLIADGAAETDLDLVVSEVADSVEAATEEAAGSAYPGVDALFRHVWSADVAGSR